MRPVGKTARLAILFLATAACGHSTKDIGGMEIKHTYSLCPTHIDSRRELYEQVRDFSNQQRARLIDRSAEAQEELSSLNSKALQDTGGDVILLTIEKPEVFRISITNLGLREKLALATRVWGDSSQGHPVMGFMENLGRFWRIQEIDGGVTDEPPC